MSLFIFFIMNPNHSEVKLFITGPKAALWAADGPTIYPQNSLHRHYSSMLFNYVGVFSP